MLTPAQIAAVAVDALDDKKAKDIKVLKTDGQTVLADYFVICNGSSAPHIKSLVDEVDRRLDEAGEPLHRREGLRSDIWVPPSSTAQANGRFLPGSICPSAAAHCIPLQSWCLSITGTWWSSR